MRSTVPSTTFSATTRWTGRDSSRRRRGSTGRTISARPGAGRCRFRRLYNGKNRTFFFAAFEGFQNRPASNALTLSVPTPEMYNGDFSNWVDSQGRQDRPSTIRRPRVPIPTAPGSFAIPSPATSSPPPASVPSRSNTSRSRRSAVVPNRAGLVPGTLRLRVEQLSVARRDDGGNDQQIQRENRPLAQQHASPVVSLQSAATTGSSLATPVRRAFPLPFNTFQSSSFDADLHRATWDWIGSRMVNHLTFGVNTFNKDAFSPNVGQDWKSKICIPNAVDCNVNMGVVSRSPSSRRGGEPQTTARSSRGFSIKDDVTLSQGSHTFKSGLHLRPPAGERLRPAGYRRPGRLQLPGNGRSWRDDAGQRRRQLVRVVPARRRGYRQDGNHPLSPAGLSLLCVLPQDDWRINAKLVLNYGARYEFTKPPVAGGDQYSDFSPTKPNPAVNNYPGALVFAGDGPGREGTRSLIPGYYGALAPRVSFAYSADDKTTIRGGVGRSFGRVTVVQGSSHFAGFIGQYVFASPDAGVTPAFNLDQGLPAYPLPPLIDPAFSNNNAVDWFNGQEAQPSGGVRQLDGVGPARSAEASDGGGGLQRRLRVAPPGGPAESESGADVGRERSDCQARPRADRRAAELANHLGGGGRRRHQGSVSELHQSGRADVRGASPRRCGPIRNTRR